MATKKVDQKKSMKDICKYATVQCANGSCSPTDDTCYLIANYIKENVSDINDSSIKEIVDKFYSELELCDGDFDEMGEVYDYLLTEVKKYIKYHDN